jgi:hypothetical protein
VREKAMQTLLASSRDAIPAAESHAADTDAETRTRLFEVLQQLACRSDEPLRDEAQNALFRLRASEVSNIAGFARLSLDLVRKTRRADALAFFAERGVHLKTVYNPLGVAMVSSEQRLEIGDDWSGEESDLRRLVDLSDVTHVRIEGDQVPENVLEYVVKMPALAMLTLRKTKTSGDSLRALRDATNLQSLHILYVPVEDEVTTTLTELNQLGLLRIYGSKLSEEAAKQLNSKLPVTKVDIRRGGFFGVGVAGHPLGCIITTVQAGSVASKAGINEGDVILSFEGKRVFDFESLTAEIAKFPAGEEVSVAMFRGNRRETVKIKLGEWEQ